MSDALPYAPVAAKADFGDQAFRVRIKNLLMRIRDIRNRIGHHDAIWTTPEFDSSGRVGFIPRKPRHTITNMVATMEKIAWLAGWIDPAIPEYMKQTDHWWAFNTLLSRKALAIYRQRGGCVETYKTLLNQTPISSIRTLTVKIFHVANKKSDRPTVAFFVPSDK